MKSPYGTTIFCDDIRDELDGKKTYVGVYFGDMVLHGAFPAVIPKFALAITYLEPLADPVSMVNIKVFVPGDGDNGDVAVDVDLPPDRLEEVGPEDIDPNAQYRVHLMHFRISPFVISKRGYVKVRAYVKGKEIRLGSIKIRCTEEGTDGTEIH
jgi:hypothetical protein